MSEDPDSPPEAQAQAEVEAGDEGAKEGHSGEEGQALDQFNNDETRAEYEDMDGVSLSEEERDAIESLPETSDSAGLSPAGDPATQVSVVSWADGSPVGTRLLDPNVFGIPVRRDVVHEVVRWQLAKRRKGNGKVSGSLALDPKYWYSINTIELVTLICVFGFIVILRRVTFGMWCSQ